MTGMIQGGWSFVIAAYVISALVYGGYIVSLWLRLKDVDSTTKDTNDELG